MGREQQSDGGGVYGRILQRLTLALEAAERSSCDGQRACEELEVRGLSSAELELIRAYQEQDARWLSGWHAAAREQALLARRADPLTRSGARARRCGSAKGARPALVRSMCCALCGTEVGWPEGVGVAACSTCGSQLLRARQRSGLYPRH